MTLHGTQCGVRAVEDGGRCRLHARIHATQLEQAGPEVPDRCNHLMKRANRWTRCGSALHVPNQPTCERHTNMFERRVERRRQQADRMHVARERAQQMITRLVQIYTARHEGGETLDTIIQHITDEAQMGNVSWHIRHVVLFHLAELIPGVDIHTARENIRVLAMQILLRQHQEHVDQHRIHRRANPNLAEFVGDRQNVHRRVVSEQTNRGMEILLQQTIPEHSRTCQSVLGYWMLTLADPVRVILRVYDDMHHWYTHETCRNAGDHLYKRMLDGLWVLIYTRMTENSRVGTELVRRLYEECRDSVSTCCEGHLTRLVNVMVGFDDAFQTPQTRSEILGEKFARIQEMTGSLEEKREAATRVLDELSVPIEERTQWITAIE